jgi:membrane-associated phospholipid phosphatase
VFPLAGALALTILLQGAPPPSAPPQPPSDKPFQHLFQNLAHDAVRLGSVDTVAIVGTGAVAAAIAHHGDVRVANWADAQGVSGYTAPWRTLGNGWTQGGAAVGTYLVGLAAHHRETEHIGSDLIRAQALNAVITRVAKAAAGRRRPGGGPDSMPSGHTSASFTSAAVLAEHFGWKAGAPAYAVASLVGWSRVRDHQHWLSDVIVGAAVGTAVGHAVAREHGRPWIVTPVASPDLVAVYLVRRHR